MATKPWKYCDESQTSLAKPNLPPSLKNVRGGIQHVIFVVSHNGPGVSELVHHKHQPLHDKINPKDCQVLSLGDSGFLQFFRVVSSDYGKPRFMLPKKI